MVGFIQIFDIYDLFIIFFVDIVQMYRNFVLDVKRSYIICIYQEDVGIYWFVYLRFVEYSKGIILI